MKLTRPFRLALLAAVSLGAVFRGAAGARRPAQDHSATGAVLTYGMGYANQRYSTLDKINKRNVAKLVPVWNDSLNNPQGQESQPIVYGGTMYVTTHTSTVAIDPLTGRQIWKEELEFAPDVFKMACCGLLNRGVAIFNGKVYRTTLDAHVIAYDAKTGKQLWKSQAIDYKLAAMTGAPLVASGVLMTGIAGGVQHARLHRRLGSRDRQEALASLRPRPAATGRRHLARRHGAKGGAPTWLTGAYDPDLDLVYWGTGNGGL
jgi:alcohol dehydrogenase (cytochrome c)